MTQQQIQKLRRRLTYAGLYLRAALRKAQRSGDQWAFRAEALLEEAKHEVDSVRAALRQAANANSTTTETPAA